jgi:hypothetical protein
MEQRNVAVRSRAKKKPALSRRGNEFHVSLVDRILGFKPNVEFQTRLMDINAENALYTCEPVASQRIGSTSVCFFRAQEGVFVRSSGVPVKEIFL